MAQEKKDRPSVTDQVQTIPKNNFKINQGLVLLGLFAAVIGLNLFWFIFGGEPLYKEAAFRFVIGSLFIFLMPGMIWGELLRFKSDHFYTTIAKSLLLTLAISILFIPIPFFFTAPIRLWVWLMIVITVTGMGLLFCRFKKDGALVFLSPLTELSSKPLKDNLLLFVQIFFIALVSFGAYRWAEDISALFGEKILHMTFVRYYYSMPMVLEDLSLTRGLPPPNLINLWEYLLAGWSILVNVDPLYLFYRCRFVMPLLGLSGMYLLVSSIYQDRRKSDAIFTGVLLMCLGGLILMSPSLYDWVKDEQYRRLFSFMGTAHHADAGTEILVALGAGMIFLALKEPSWRNILLLCAAIVSSFLWHPREFFQAAIYAGILGLTLLVIPSKDRLARLKGWVKVMMVFFVIAIILYGLIKAFIPPQSLGYDEFKIKEAALRYAFDLDHLTGIRNLFRFPLNFVLSSSTAPDVFLDSQGLYQVALKQWHLMPLVLLAALSIPLLLYYGSRQSKEIAVFTFLLWFIVLCWNFGMLMVIVLTYSEIHMSTLRIIYLFYYILIADAIYVVALRFYKPEGGLLSNASLVGGFALLGVVLIIWWNLKSPFFDYITYPLSFLVWGSVIATLFSFNGFALNKPSLFQRGGSGLIAVLCMTALFLPLMAKEYFQLGSDVINGKRDTIYWHSDFNPCGLSSSLVSFLKGLEPKQTFVVNPNSASCIFIYMPQYVAVPPRIIGTIISATAEQESAALGLNPLYNIQSKYGMKMAAIEELQRLTPIFHDTFEHWKALSAVHYSKLQAVTSPLSVQNTSPGSPNFMFSRLEGGVVRINYDKDARNIYNKESIKLGYLFKRVPDLQNADYISFVVTMRTDSELSIPVKLIAFDQIAFRGVLDNEYAAIEVVGEEWKKYTVTKRVRQEHLYLGAGLIWSIPQKKGWIEIKDPKIYLYNLETPLAKTLSSAGIEKILDYGAVVAWLDRYKPKYILVNRPHYDTLKRFIESYGSKFQIVFDDPGNKDMVVRYR